mmetsp:Transcript_49939/g.109079  ORF Transcript_49939/g.109079 Transcript_49939/m.109079 type:complete len:175 (-) Transcript_49939:160-684(-)
MLTVLGGAVRSVWGKQTTFGPNTGPNVIVVSPLIFLLSSLPGPVPDLGLSPPGLPAVVQYLRIMNLCHRQHNLAQQLTEHCAIIWCRMWSFHPEGWWIPVKEVGTVNQVFVLTRLRAFLMSEVVCDARTICLVLGRRFVLPFLGARGQAKLASTRSFFLLGAWVPHALRHNASS